MKELLPLTGYIRGGCSPIGMKKHFPTFIDATATGFDTIYVSAGVRGLQAEISPADLAAVARASFRIYPHRPTMSNTFGTILRLTTYGESHGAAVGGILDGMPAGVAIDIKSVQRALDRRRPGQSAITTARAEADRVEILSGLLDGVTTGTPIAFEVRNADHHSSDYDNMAHTFRPSHADYTYTARYGIRDHRGGSIKRP